MWIEEQKASQNVTHLVRSPLNRLMDSFGNFTLGVVATSEGWGVPGKTYALGRGGYALGREGRAPNEWNKGSDAVGGTPGGWDEGPDAEDETPGGKCTTLGGVADTPSEEYDIPEGRGIEPTGRSDAPNEPPDNLLAEVNTTPGAEEAVVNDSDPEVGNGLPNGGQLGENENGMERAVVVIPGKGKGSEADRDVVMLAVM